MDLFDFLPYRIKKIDQIFHYYLKFVRFYFVRWKFSIDDYLRRESIYTTSDLLFTLFCCLRAWIAIAIIMIHIVWPENEWIISRNSLSKIVPIKGLDALLLYSILIILYVEKAWFSTFRMIRYYQFISFRHMAKIFDEREYNKVNRKNLLRSFIYGGYVSGAIYRTFTVYLFFWALYVLVRMIEQYQNDQLRMMTIVSTILLGTLIFQHFVYIAGLCFTVFFCFLFTCDLLVCKFRQLKEIVCVESIKKLIKTKRNLFLFDDIDCFHRNFRSKYSEIFQQIADYNNDYQLFFLMSEMLSKVTIVVVVLFYSEQDVMTIYSYIITTTLTSVFLMTTIIYSRISYFDSYNLIVYRKMSNWSARLPLSLWKRKSFKNWKRFRAKSKTFITNFLKSHHFNQALTQNRIGFTCGNLFYIDKNRYAELLLMNIGFVLLFYKKSILNQSIIQ